MQAARNLVRIMVELAAGMQLGHDDFGGAAMEFVVFVNGGGYASAIVADRYAVIGMDGYDYVVAIAGQGFVDGIIDDLEHHVMQARADRKSTRLNSSH